MKKVTFFFRQEFRCFIHSLELISLLSLNLNLMLLEKDLLQSCFVLFHSCSIVLLDLLQCALVLVQTCLSLFSVLLQCRYSSVLNLLQSCFCIASILPQSCRVEMCSRISSIFLQLDPVLF